MAQPSSQDSNDQLDFGDSKDQHSYKVKETTEDDSTQSGDPVWHPGSGLDPEP